MAFISLGGATENLSLNIGIILILVASLSESIYFVFQNAYLKKIWLCYLYHVYDLVRYYFHDDIFFPGLGDAIIDAPIDITVVVIYLGIFPTVIPYFTLAYITSQTGASEATSSLYLTPVTAFLIAWLWLGELPTTYAIIGGFITLVGVFLSYIKKTE